MSGLGLGSSGGGGGHRGHGGGGSVHDGGAGIRRGSGEWAAMQQPVGLSELGDAVAATFTAFHEHGHNHNGRGDGTNARDGIIE